MQSTGHSSMQDLSSRSTQGCAMMYVTSELLFRLCPQGVAPSIAVPRSRRVRTAPPGRRLSPKGPGETAGYQLAKTEPAGAPASLTHPGWPGGAGHRNPAYRTSCSRNWPAWVTSHAATAQPTLDCGTRTDREGASPPEAALRAASGPNARTTARRAGLSRAVAWLRAPGQHQTPRGAV